MPDLPVELIDEAARRRLMAIAASVPDAMTTFGFECRLSEGESAVDLGLAVAPENGGTAVLATLDEGRRAGPCLGDDPRWRRIRDFARDWSEPTSPLRGWVPFVFMEYDAAVADDPIPVPSMFVALDAPLDGPALRGRGADYPPLVALRRACALLSGEDLPADVDDRVVEAYRALPRDAWVMHVGVLLGREVRGVRLSVCAAGDQIGPYLARLGGSEAAAGAGELIGHLEGAVPWSQVDFDLAPEVLPRLGFGLQPHQEDGWRPLIDVIERSGWCTRAKARALLRWRGATVVTLASGPSVLVRKLSHVKLVRAPGAPTTAKAYLGVTPIPAAVVGRSRAEAG